MRTLIAALFMGLFAAVAVAENPMPVGTDQNDGYYVTDRFIVTLQPGVEALMLNQTTSGVAITSNIEIDLLCEQNSVISVERYYPYPVRNEKLRSLVERMYVFKLMPNTDAMDVVHNFLNCSDIECSDPWTVAKLDYIPNDPSIGSQWALSKISAFGAWDVVRGDTTASVIIAIDDSGIYYNHPDLQANIWVNGPEDINGNGIFDNYSSTSGGDINNVDDDGNGYPDDVVGWDFGFIDNNPIEDAPDHGTHVAGCASMVADNNTGGAGPGFSAKLMATKATNTPGFITHGYPAMIYAADNGAHIVNCSWGSVYYSSGEQNICNYLYSMGVLIVASAGNSNSPAAHYPSGYNNVLSVASTTNNDTKSYFSNYGSTVDISSPGSNIYSTWGASSYSYLDGTSMASPIVAGVAALVKAQNPSHSPDQISNILMVSADTIDHLNPGYQGQLGAGRVNAQAAVSQNSPIIHLLNYQITITNDDGDGVLNPGESINLGVELENVNQPGSNVVATLRVPDGVSITDSVFNIGTFPGGQQVNNFSDPFAMTFGSVMIPDTYEFDLHISADGSYNVDLEIEIELSLNLVNFPVSLPDAIASHPLICDFDGDGSIEILIGCNDGKLYSIEINGANTPGWPATTTDDISSAPAVGNLDGDSDFEVVAIARDGQLYAWDHTGSVLPGFPVATGGSVFTGPTLADLDGNNDLEIIQPNFQTSNVDIYNHDGTVFGNWPYTSTIGWYGSAAVGDIDSDNLPEVVIGGFDTNLHVFNADKTEVSGFPVTLDGFIWVAPVIGNIDPSDPEPEIVIATQTGSVYLINHDGSTVAGWPISIGTAVKSSPSLGDLDNDGSPEIIFGASNSNLYVYDSDGTSLNGFPVTLLANITASAVVADISGNGTPDIVIANGASNTYVYAFDAQGQALQNFPIPTSANGTVAASPAVWDLDADGDMDIVVGVQNNGQNLDVIDYKASSSLIYANWPVFGKDKNRSHNFEAYDPVKIDGATDIVPLQFSLSQNYPNPFNSSTVISFSLDEPSNYSLEVFDILGRNVKNLDSGFKQAGAYSVTWNGLNDNGNEVASGVYFYKIKVEDRIAIKRLLYLR